MRMKFLLRLFLLGVVYYGVPIKGFGQVPGDVSEQIKKLLPNPTQQSPNIAAIQKYGDFSVNLYTGIPDISIPLYEIVAGDINVPIVLSYHAGGVRYTDRASWAGLGWSVQVGGQITRTIAGNSDESSFLNGTNDYTVDSYDYCNNIYYKQQTASGSNDREPDLFSYSFPGASGRFVLRQGGQSPLLFPESAIKITRNQGYSYDITDTKGTMYRFGADWSGGNAAQEHMSAYSGGTVTSGVVTWYLQRIKSPNTNDFVNILYQKVGDYNSSEIESSITLLDNCTTSNPQNLPCTTYNAEETLASTSNSSSQMGVKEIYFNTGKVVFIMGGSRTDVPGGSSLKRLSRIEVYLIEDFGYYTDEDEEIPDRYRLLKSFIFLNNGYFALSSNTNATARLKLDGVEVRDGANTLINKYSFAYHTTTFSWDKTEGSFRRDLFGFYNGKTANTNLIPKETIEYRPLSEHAAVNKVIGGADRSTDTTFYKEGVLKKITFPTGGYTEFQFEPHKYDDGGVIRYGGGLRIKKLIKYDGQNTYSTLYKYGTSEDGVGHKNFDVRNFHFRSTLYKRDGYGVSSSSQRQYVARTWVSNSVVGAGFDDAPIVYTLVSEYANSSNGTGKTVYEYDNNYLIGDGVFAVPYSNKIWRNKKSWERGKVTKITKYDANNAIKEVTTKTYTKYKGQRVKVGQAVIQTIVGGGSGPYFQPCNSTDGGQQFDGHQYMLATIEQDVGTYLETSSKVDTYYGSDFIQNLTNRGYHATYLQPTYEEIVSSGNPGTVRTNFRYNYDIVSTASTYTGWPDVLKQMLLKNMIATPVEQYTWVKEGSGANEIISGQLTEYRKGIYSASLFVPSAVYFLETAAPVTSYAPLAVSGTSALSKDSRYKLRMSFNDYDSNGNLLQYSLSNGMTRSFIYAYGSEHAMAEASNATVGNIAYTSFETTEKGNWSYTAGAESLVLPEQAKTGRKVYLLDRGQVTKTVTGNYKLSFWARKNSATAATLTINGTAYSGTIDDKWRLIEVTGINSATISGSGAVIDEFRIHPSTAQMTSYTFRPLVGITSQMDVKNHGMYYHYDPFGRLETIKNEDGHILKHYEYTYDKP